MNTKNPVNGNTSKKCTKLQIQPETVVISESQLVLIKYNMFSSTSRDLRQMICQQNPYIFDTFKLNAANNNSHLSTCRLEYGNGVFYPELEYDTESKTRIYYDLMNYSWKKNDYNTGTQLNISNFSSLLPKVIF